jgi:tetratricopeptide (TPR) repeat protein
LHYLAEAEIKRVIEKLSELGCLFDLESASEKERFEAFKERAGRQLLVALHEATQSGSFRDIVLDEYRKVTPILAQRLYLTVCVFHRLGIFVRAGIVNRLYEVPFERFSEEFFGPLDQVVRAQYDKRVVDNVYRARHRDIADIVFRGALTNVGERLEFYIGALKYLNLDFKSDRDAFTQLISARAVGEFFANPSHGEEIYREAIAVNPEKVHILHQRGIYRMNCEDQNLSGAKDDLKEASELRPSGFRIVHSLAELELRFAQRANSKLQVEKHIANSRAYCDSILNAPNAGYALSTKVKASFLELQTLAKEKIDDRELELLLEALQSDIEEMKRREPDNVTILQTEARVSLWLNEEEGAKAALTKAFEKNPRRQFISKSLIDIAKQNNDKELAMNYAKKVLEAKPEDASANYQYGKLGVEFECLDLETLEYHFSRAYLDGDSNLDARLLHARTLFLTGDFGKAKKIFKRLSREQVPFSQKSYANYPVESPRDGRVVQLEATHAWIEDFSNGRRVYARHSKFDKEVWDLLMHNEPVVFTLAFSYMGCCASDVKQRM